MRKSKQAIYLDVVCEMSRRKGRVTPMWFLALKFFFQLVQEIAKKRRGKEVTVGDTVRTFRNGTWNTLPMGRLMHAIPGVPLQAGEPFPGFPRGNIEGVGPTMCDACVCAGN